MPTAKVEAIEVDLSVEWGSDSSFEFTIADQDGVAQDITNDDVRLTVKDQIGGTEQIVKQNGPNGSGSHQDPVNGKTRFTFTDSDLADADLEKTKLTVWRYAVRRRKSTGEIETHFKGALRVEVHAGVDDPFD